MISLVCILHLSTLLRDSTRRLLKTEATFPLLQRRLPKRMISERMDPEALMQAFVCSIATTDELGAFLTFFFSPSKADPSVPGPCSTRSFEARRIGAGRTTARRTRG